MKMRLVRKFLLLFLVLLTGPLMAKTMIVKDASKVITLSKAQNEFTVQLPANATTGYSWVLNGNYNPNLITAVSHKYVAPGKKLVGAPGTSVWTFQVQAAAFKVPTKLTMTLDYMRPWEKKVSKSQQLTIITHK